MWLFENLKARILKSIITWSEMGQQTTQAKEVYEHRFLRFFLSVFSLAGSSVDCLKVYVKHSTHCLAAFPNSSHFVKNTLPVPVAFSTLLLVFANVVKHVLSSLIHYIDSCFHWTSLTCLFRCVHKQIWRPSREIRVSACQGFRESSFVF